MITVRAVVRVGRITPDRKLAATVLRKTCLFGEPQQDEEVMGARRTGSKTIATSRERVPSAPLPAVPARMLMLRPNAPFMRPEALRGPRTLEDRLIPGLFLFAFVGLLAIQVFHALTH